MKLIHLTAKRFENLSADSIYISNLARQFSKMLESDYLLVVGSLAKGQFKGVNTINLNLLSRGTGLVYFLLPYFVYFFWLPYFLLFKIKTGIDTVFFASDPHLLWMLIFWKKIFFMNFKITSDWHMLHEDWKDNFIARNSDVLVTTSEKLKRMLTAKTRVSEEKIKTVYGGVNLDKFRPVDVSEVRRKYSLPIDRKIAAYIGLFKTMGMEKGVDTMIRSAKFLEDDTVLVFVGGKINEITQYSRLAKELNVEERCRFIEKISEQQEIHNIEQAIDALVIPYPDKPHFRNYGFPMKVYEYMAAKKPIVYSKLDLTEEVLYDCGFAFTPDDSKKLADMLNYVLSPNNKDEVERKVELAYEKLRNLTWENKAKEIIEFQQKHG